MKLVFIKLKPFLLWIGLAIPTAVISVYAYASQTTYYTELLKPDFALPPELFPLVWILSYAVFSVAAYLLAVSGSEIRRRTLLLYVAQLILTTSWPFIFFVAQDIRFSMIWLGILLVILIFTTVSFYFCSFSAGIMITPHLVFIIYLFILSYTLHLLNSH